MSGVLATMGHRAINRAEADGEAMAAAVSILLAGIHQALHVPTDPVSILMERCRCGDLVRVDVDHRCTPPTVVRRHG